MKFSQHVLHHYYDSIIDQAGSDHEDKPVTAVSHQCPDFTHVDSMKCMHAAREVTSPVCKSHALEEFGERGVYGEVRRAGFAEVVRLTGLFVDSVEVVAFLRGVLAVGRGHHEVPAVDDLRLQPQMRLLRVRVVILLLLYAGRWSTVLVP